MPEHATALLTSGSVLRREHHLIHRTRHGPEALLIRLVAAQEVEQLLPFADRLLDEAADEHHARRMLRQIRTERRVVQRERVAKVVGKGASDWFVLEIENVEPRESHQEEVGGEPSEEAFAVRREEARF